MTPKRTTVLRMLRKIISFVTLLLITCVVVVSATAYVAVTTPHLPLLRRGLGYVGRVVDGQVTEDLKLEARLLPRTAELDATATLRLRSVEPQRSRFYFFLNPGLRVDAVNLTAPAGAPIRGQVYQLGLLLVVTLDTPIAADDSLDLRLHYRGKPWLDVIGGANMLNEREVLLNVDAFWYPVDAQSFFTADVSVRLPRSMRLVHNGAEVSRTLRGDEQEVRWKSTRRIAGTALIAGPYRNFERDDAAGSYQLVLAEDVALDHERVLALMAEAHQFLEQRLGTAGFDRVTIFVSRSFRRGFNDGSGTIGLSLRYFRSDDYAYALIAHEIAHNWWGGTVTGGWLTPGRGAQWVVEGFAEFSSLLATEAKFGADGVTQRLTSEFFDPMRQQAVASMSVLDNALDEARARDTIYRKGAYVLWMLRRAIGDDACTQALRTICSRFAYSHANDGELQAVFEEVSGQKLDAFFADWVRGAKLADLSLDAVDNERVQVNNLAAAGVPPAIDLWNVPEDGSEPVRSTASVGDTIAIPKKATLLLDPLLAYADVNRENNRFPRREDPFAVSAANGSYAIAMGDPAPWGRAAIAQISADQRPLHTWELKRGLLQAPAWAPDDLSLVLSVSDPDDLIPSIVTLKSDNSQRTVAAGTAPVPGQNGTIYAAYEDRILHISQNGDSSILVRQPKWTLDLPTPAPDGRRIAYVSARRNAVDLRLVDADGKNDRSLLTWDRDRMLLRWAADGKHLFVVTGGDDDWQIWSVDMDGFASAVLVHDAAALQDLAVSPSGSRLAFTAAATRAYPRTRRQVYVLDLGERAARAIDIPDYDAGSVAWQDDSTLLVVSTAARSGTAIIYPRQRNLHRVAVDAGAVESIR